MVVKKSPGFCELYVVAWRPEENDAGTKRGVETEEVGKLDIVVLDGFGKK